MLSSIHPLGERGKNNRFGLTAAAFVIGAVLGGATTGLVLAPVSALAGAVLSDTAAVLAAAVLALFGALAEWRGTKLPSVPRQVNEDWLTEYRGWVYGGGFGLQLGAGVATYITSAAVYVALDCAVLVGSPLGSIAVMATFGLSRGLSILAARSITTPDRLRTFHQGLQRTAPAAKTASWVSLALLAVSVPVTLL